MGDNSIQIKCVTCTATAAEARFRHDCTVWATIHKEAQESASAEGFVFVDIPHGIMGNRSWFCPQCAPVVRAALVGGKKK